jgi:hypothetical protein
MGRSSLTPPGGRAAATAASSGEAGVLETPLCIATASSALALATRTLMPPFPAVRPPASSPSSATADRSLAQWACSHARSHRAESASCSSRQQVQPCFLAVRLSCCVHIDTRSGFLTCCTLCTYLDTPGSNMLFKSHQIRSQIQTFIGPQLPQ